MKAVILEKPRNLRLINKPRTPLHDHDIRIKVAKVGICGSDIHIYEGGIPWVNMPVILGHELSGTIVEVGNSAQFDVGQRVTVIPLVYCGQCDFCRRRQTNRCSNLRIYGVHLDGAYAEEIVVADYRIRPLNSNISLDQAALMDPLSVAVHAINCSQIKPKENAVILGAGAIGLLAIQVLTARNCSFLTVTGRISSKLNLARKLGANLALNATEVNVVEEGLRACRGGYDIVLDFVCSEETINQAALLGKPGARIVLIGAPFPVNKPAIDYVSIYRKELTLIASRGYTDEEFDYALSLMESGKIQTDSLITARFRLDQTKEALQFVQTKRKDSIKVLIEPYSS